MRNQTRKTIEAHRDTGIGGIEVTISVEYPATPGGAPEAARHVANLAGEIQGHLAEEGEQ